VTATAILSASDSLSGVERTVAAPGKPKPVGDLWGEERRPLYYDRKTQVIDLDRWLALSTYGDTEYGPTAMHYKVLRRTRVGGYMVSTVWLGIDHGFGRHRAPVIFETMIFADESWDADRSDPDREKMLDLDMDRYSYEQEAFAGHEQMVMTVRAATGADDVTEEWPE
jgi:hypothetical protein